MLNLCVLWCTRPNGPNIKFTLLLFPNCFQIDEYYAPGHPLHVRQHTMIEVDRRQVRKLFFYATARVDGLVSRENDGAEVSFILCPSKRTWV